MFSNPNSLEIRPFNTLGNDNNKNDDSKNENDNNKNDDSKNENDNNDIYNK